MSSSEEDGVELTPLSTSTPTTSKSPSGISFGAKAFRASVTARSFGLRVLPTTTMIFFMKPTKERADSNGNARRISRGIRGPEENLRATLLSRFCVHSGPASHIHDDNSSQPFATNFNSTWPSDQLC